ncbi:MULTISPECIES: hypothetical protein [Bradyrhizobium]|uniref:Uncharacterized protein n=2 Tax=Bradyrhizobium TaxID=374 RepID=A0ABY0Q019_9BRAD|nr:MULTISPECIES: hypothetical protein [Bradyrhizobium]SDJ18082.1 hypothetical protein SAMN05444163_4765 [Bradyrhizobium ottawaense]SEC84499.1 hypothetical protein SAMN05444171_2398 [Bradyrhizobium lablabi]
MTTTENVGFAKIGFAKTGQPKNPGHRYQPGHPHHPRKHGSRTQARVFKRRAAKIFAAIVAERDNELSVTQLIHAQNAADLGASIMEMKDRRETGEFIDPISITNLVNAQRRSLSALDE